MDLKWIEPESRFLVNSVFRRNFDTFTEQAKRAVNWLVLAGDVVGGIILLEWLF